MMILLAFNWSSFAANLGQFILAFSILIILHELGHFLTARWFGCRVEKFYLFFNPWFSLWKKKKGDTEYGIGWIPLGGYVKISGMIDESMDKEAMKSPPQPYEFRSKPAWQRLIIMLGGVIVNFILALIIFAMILFVWGEERLPVKNMKYGLAADSLALSVGIKDGDIITAVNNKPLVYENDLSKNMLLSKGVVLSVKRNGKDTSITLPEGFISKLTKNQLKGFVSPRVPVIVDTMVKEIIAQGGYVDKFIGDAVMAVFRGDYHLDRALDASLAVRNKINSLPVVEEQFSFTPKVSIGINSGEMISGNIGSASLRRLDYTVIGDVVNTAQRLQAAAAQNQILIDENCFKKVSESFNCKKVGEISLKNKSAKVVVYEVMD